MDENEDQNGLIPEATSNRDFWSRMRKEIFVGQAITGTVICRRHFGVFLDIGYGTNAPALLLVPEFVDAQSKRYEFDDYPALGESVNAWIVGINWDQHKIALTQNESRVDTIET